MRKSILISKRKSSSIIYIRIVWHQLLFHLFSKVVTLFHIQVLQNKLYQIQRLYEKNIYLQAWDSLLQCVSSKSNQKTLLYLAATTVPFDAHVGYEIRQVSVFPPRMSLCMQSSPSQKLLCKCWLRHGYPNFRWHLFAFVNIIKYKFTLEVVSG